MKGIVYKGTAGGYLEFGRKELLKAAFAGQSLANDANRIQRRLNKAAAQDRTKRIVTKFKRGGIA